MRTTAILFFIVLLIALAGALLFVAKFNLSALPDPGANGNVSSRPHPPLSCAAAAARRFRRRPPTARRASPQGILCTEWSAQRNATGSTVSTPTDAGRWMYPRAADLTAPSILEYSDRELFWIVKNGIRLTGMPAFGKVEPDEHLWNLAHYVRTLPGPRR